MTDPPRSGPSHSGAPRSGASEQESASARSTNPERSASRFRLARLAVTLGGIERLVGSFAALLRVPLLIWGLELYQYGLYMAILGVVATANLLDFGLHFGVLNAVADARGRDDRASISSIVATAFLLYSAIVGSVLLLVLPMLSFVPLDWLLGIDAELAPVARDVMLLALLGLLSTLPLKVFSAGLHGFQKQYAVSGIRTLMHITQMFAIAGAALVFRGQLMPIVIATVATDVLMWVSAALFAVRDQPELRLVLRNASRKLAPALAATGIAFLVANFANLFKYTLGNTVVSHGLGPAAVATFSVPLALFFTAYGLAAIASDSFWPAYGEAAARGEWVWVDRAFGLGAKAALGVSAAFAVLGALFGDLLIDVWTPKDIAVSTPLLVALAVWLLAQTCFAMSSSLVAGLGYVKVSASFSLVEGILVFGASVWSVERFGVEGVAISMAVLGVLSASAFLGIAVRRVTRGRVHPPLRTLANVALCVAVTAAVGIVYRSAVGEGPVLAVLGGGVLLAGASYVASAWSLVLDADERRRLAGWLRTRARRGAGQG